MDAFKIRNFTNNHIDEAYPWLQTLSDRECATLRSQLQGRIPKSDSREPSSLQGQLDRIGHVVPGANAEDSDFSLNAVLSGELITAQETVYLNWKGFDEIDEMRFTDVCTYFDDIWYPSSDDLDLFDGSLDWVLSVAHHGTVKLGKLVRVTHRLPPG
jgi:hypothetical protein